LNLHGGPHIVTAVGATCLLVLCDRRWVAVGIQSCCQHYNVANRVHGFSGSCCSRGTPRWPWCFQKWRKLRRSTALQRVSLFPVVCGRQLCCGGLLRDVTLLLLSTWRPRCRQAQRRRRQRRRESTRRRHVNKATCTRLAPAGPTCAHQRRYSFRSWPAENEKVAVVNVEEGGGVRYFCWIAADDNGDNSAWRRYGEAELRRETDTIYLHQRKSFRKTSASSGDGRRLTETRRRNASCNGDASDWSGCGTRRAQPAVLEASTVPAEVDRRSAGVRRSTQVVLAADRHRRVDKRHYWRPAIDRNVVRVLPDRQPVVRLRCRSRRRRRGAGVRRGGKSEGRSRRYVDGHSDDMSWNNRPRLLHGARIVQPPYSAAAAASSSSYRNAVVWKHCRDARCKSFIYLFIRIHSR